MGAVWAEEVLRDEWGALTPESARTLTLIATGDDAAAEDAFCKKEMDRLRALTNNG